MNTKQIRNYLINIVNQSEKLPEVICVVLPKQKPYGGAFLPVYGFNSKEQNITTKQDAIDLINEYQKRDFVQHNGMQFDGDWRHLAYEKAIK